MDVLEWEDVAISRDQKTGSSGNHPLFSVIIPVLQEAHLIKGLLDHVMDRIGDLDTEILVVDGSEQGDTLNAIQRQDVVRIRTSPGRGHQMNVGADNARGDVLVFLHADTRLPEGCFRTIRKALQDGFKAGAFSVTFTGTSNPFLRLLGWGHTLRSRITRIPYGDQVHFFDSTFFQSMGGYAEGSIMEDADLMNRIRKRGTRIAILDLKVGTSARRFEEKGIFRSLFRYAVLRTLDGLGAPLEEW